MNFVAQYNMEHRPSTYDFFVWMVHVQSMGATAIVVKTEGMRSRKWPMDETLRRLKNYIMPGPALAGLPVRDGIDGVDTGSSNMQVLAEAAGRSFKRLRSVLPPAVARYTVTIRNTGHNPHKNSDEDVWREFSRRIGAHLIEDHRVAPIGLHERMALYAGAEMNFGVTNGPLALITLADYPMTMMCDPEKTAKGFGGHGIKVGDQIPYALPHQRLVWERATLDNLMREYEHNMQCVESC